MSYASAADLKARYEDARLAELTDPLGAATDDTKLDLALADASAETDSYLAARFALPIAADQVPTSLVQIVCDIAMYRLFSLRPMGDVEDARARYKDAIARLKLIADGTLDLGLSATLKTAATSPSTLVSTGGRVYDQASLADFRHAPAPFGRGFC